MKCIIACAAGIVAEAMVEADDGHDAGVEQHNGLVGQTRCQPDGGGASVQEVKVSVEVVDTADMERHLWTIAVVAVSCSGDSGGGKTDLCENEICSGHGECVVNTDGRAACVCEPGYADVALTCVADCLAVDCGGLGGCIVVEGEPRCVCDTGYVGQGIDCVPAPDTCDGVECSRRGACIEEGGEPACICEYGYAPQGLDCVPSSCTGVRCTDHGACELNEGAPSCHCDPGYMAVGLGCISDECRADACSGRGACALVDSKMECTCDHGYVAVDDECRPAPCAGEDCSNHGACVEGSEGLECICDPGYVAVGLSCRPRCTGVDCSGHGACVQDRAGIRCLCDPGYVAEGENCVAEDVPVADGGADGGADSGVPLSDGGGSDGDSGGAMDGSTPDGGSDSGSGGDSSAPIELDWVTISGGSFQMGSNSGDSDERPVHEVTVPTFEMLQTEVTVAQYGECFDRGPCTAPNTGGSCNWANRTLYANHPVNCVDWHQMVAFCEWAGGRLPSEAEWEYAARSGELERTYPWGEETPTCEYAVMDDATHTDGCDTGRTMAVCSKTQGNTEQGLCDMAGNVWEWVQDWYHSTYDGAPTNGSAWVDSGSNRVVRGGGFDDAAYYLRAAHRTYYAPGGRSYDIGARCGR